MRGRAGRVALALAVVVSAAGGPATAQPADDEPPAVERDGPLPHLDRVGPLEDGPDDGMPPEPGAVEVLPAVSEVVVPPDRRVALRHVVANTTDERVALSVDVFTGVATPDGPGPGVIGPVPTEADVRLVAPVERLQLDPGEGAELHSTAQADPGASQLFALRVRTPDGQSATAHVVVAEETVPAATDLGLGIDGAGRAEVELRTDRPGVVDVRLRARSWAGTTTDRTLADVVVGPEGRRLTLQGPASRWPGLVRATAVAVSGDEEARATARGVTLPPFTLAGLAALLLLVAAAGLRVRRRRGDSGPRSTASP